ncbi:MAG: hypothetical protein JXR63_07855 [Spirochaetales bacterium]|nr:hypothetical protein [Spirochaetales bacterium]
MNKKLTLNIDDSLIDFAKHYSAESRQSVSSLFENYLIRLRDCQEDLILTDNTLSIYGITEKENLPDKEEMRKDFYEKSID